MANAHIKLLARWLGELRLVLFAFVFVGLAVALIYSFGSTEQSVRIVGLGLQSLGLGTVIWGIVDTREHFGHLPVREHVKAWFRRFPLRHRSAHLSAEGVQASVSITGGRVSQVFRFDASASIDDRIANIEKGIEILQERIKNTEQQIDREKRALEDAIKMEKRSREGADSELLKKLEVASTGGIYISAIGALWLFVGVVLSSASPEISVWLQ